MRGSKRASQPAGADFLMQQMWQQEGWNRVGNGTGAEATGGATYPAQHYINGGINTGQMDAMPSGVPSQFQITAMDEGDM